MTAPTRRSFFGLAAGALAVLTTRPTAERVVQHAAKWRARRPSMSVRVECLHVDGKWYPVDHAGKVWPLQDVRIRILSTPEKRSEVQATREVRA